jgi:hypothetical protein
MTRIDSHTATRILVENAFSNLIWHEDACKSAGFKGISQVWKDEPAWYFWLHSVQGGFMLRLHDDEQLNDSQYVSLSVHYYPSSRETGDSQLSPEELRLLSDSSVFDMPTCTPRFEQFETCLPYFVAAEIGLMIGADNEVQLLIYSTERGWNDPSAKFLDLLVNALNFATKTHHRQALQLADEEGMSLFLIYDTGAFQDFQKYFELDGSSFAEPPMNELLSRWQHFAQKKVDCSMNGTCCCH